MAELANLHLLLLKNYSDDIRQLVEYQMKLLKQYGFVLQYHVRVCSTTMINNLMPIYIPLIIQIFKETLSLIKHVTFFLCLSHSRVFPIRFSM